MHAQYVRPSDQSTSPPPPGPLAQQPDNSFANHLSIGGSFALQFGDVTFVELEPLLSYHLNESFMIGVGPIYQYQNVSDQLYGYAYTASVYGGRVAALYFLPDDLSKIFVMGEFDALNVPEASLNSYQINRGYITLPMLGIGYKEVISDKFFFCIYGLWNFNNSPYNPFSSTSDPAVPIINFGMDIGLWH